MFVLFLSISGIALNHSHDLGLDRHYVSWPWLLDAYGLGKTEPYAGMVRLAEFVVVGDADRVHVLLESGELVETLEIGGTLSGGVERVGQAGDRVVLQSGAALYRSDADVTAFERWPGGKSADVSWSPEADRDTAGLEVLRTAWRGEGVTIERLLLDLHSGRVFSLAGTIFMDIVALGLILLGITGLVLARRRNGKL